MNGAENVGALHVEVDGNLNARKQNIPQSLAIVVPKPCFYTRK